MLGVVVVVVFIHVVKSMRERREGAGTGCLYNPDPIQSFQVLLYVIYTYLFASFNWSAVQTAEH